MTKASSRPKTFFDVPLNSANKPFCHKSRVLKYNMKYNVQQATDETLRHISFWPMALSNNYFCCSRTIKSCPKTSKAVQQQIESLFGLKLQRTLQDKNEGVKWKTIQFKSILARLDVSKAPKNNFL